MSEMLWCGGGGGTGAPRFSLLHMDDGEDYVLDVAGSMTAPASAPGISSSAETGKATGNKQGPLRGIVRLLTKSVVFEPDNVDAPVVKFSFANVDTAECLPGKHVGFQMLCGKAVYVSEAGSVAAPRRTVVGVDGPWRFDTNSESLAKVFDPLSGLLKVAKQNVAVAEATLSAMRSRREDRFIFDKNNLVDNDENVLFDAPGAQITPLCREPGRLVVTNRRVYFQPLYDVSVGGGSKKQNTVRTCCVSDIVAVARRTHVLRPLGLELFFKRKQSSNTPDNPTTSNLFTSRPCALFTFRSEVEREAGVTVARAACADAGNELAGAGSTLLDGGDDALREVSEFWRTGSVSNLEYLLYLNLVAGRGWNDLSQWCVMPWVLRDYGSNDLDVTDWNSFRDLERPVGALNTERLEMFKKRRDEMKSAGLRPYLYGTHYSAPGYVLYWLLRALPLHHLKLQNGRFDAPDRLFHGVAETWESALRSTADVKELIPEFFVESNESYSFLVNSNNLPLGVRQVDGAQLGDVVLPPWANGSPHVFVAKMRQALESEYVSSNMHHWIDLIFGCAQTGVLADKIDNVFHPLTYGPGALAELNNTKDATQVKAKETQIQEFGRAPRRVFTSPHVARERGAHEKWAKNESTDGRHTDGASTAASRARDVLETLVSLCPPSGRGDGEGLDNLGEVGKAWDLLVADAPTNDATHVETTEMNERENENDSHSDPPVVRLLLSLDETQEKDSSYEHEHEGMLCCKWALPRAHATRVTGIEFAHQNAAAPNASVLSVSGDAVMKVHAVCDGALEHSSRRASGARGTGHAAPFATSLALLGGNGARAGVTLLPGDTVFDEDAEWKKLVMSPGAPVACVGCTDGGVYAYGAEVGRVLSRLPAWDAGCGCEGLARGYRSPHQPGSEVAALATPKLRPDLLFGVNRNGVVRVWDVAVGKTVCESGVVGVSGAFRTTNCVLTAAHAAVIGGVYVRSATAPTRGVLPAAANAGPRLHVAELVNSTLLQGTVSNTVALFCDARANLALVGGDDQEVTAWDPRCARAAWVAEAFAGTRRPAANRGVVGLTASLSQWRATAACADGGVRLLDLRKCGEVRDEVFFETALSCLAGNGRDGVFVGGADGAVEAWNWSDPCRTQTKRKVIAYSVSSSPVSSLSVAAEGGALAVGWDDGSVGVFEEKRGTGSV